MDKNSCCKGEYYIEYDDKNYGIHVWHRKVNDILRENHITYGNNNGLMVTLRIMNVFGSGSEFVDYDSYQVCSNVLLILQVNQCGNIFWAPLDDNIDYIPFLEK